MSTVTNGWTSGYQRYGGRRDLPDGHSWRREMRYWNRNGPGRQIIRVWCPFDGEGETVDILDGRERRIRCACCAKQLRIIYPPDLLTLLRARTARKVA